MSKLKIKKGDTVRVIAGKDKGKEGKILVVDRKTDRVIVEGVNMATKHVKPRGGVQQGGIVLHEGKPTRLGIKSEVKVVDGKEVTVRSRFVKSTGDVID